MSPSRSRSRRRILFAAVALTSLLLIVSANLTHSRVLALASVVAIGVMLVLRVFGRVVG